MKWLLYMYFSHTNLRTTFTHPITGDTEAVAEKRHIEWVRNNFIFSDVKRLEMSEKWVWHTLTVASNSSAMLKKLVVNLTLCTSEFVAPGAFTMWSECIPEWEKAFTCWNNIFWNEPNTLVLYLSCSKLFSRRLPGCCINKPLYIHCLPSHHSGQITGDWNHILKLHF